jgi:hypothetical protein
MPVTDAAAPGERDGGARWLPLLLVFVSLLPNLRAALPGLTYYLRDFSLTFYPVREFFASELREGRWPFWNPYLHEGSALLPALYPLEFLQVLWSGPSAVSWLLTLHFPLAALGAYLLARDLGADRGGAFVAGALFSMGGFSLSCLNLYCFLQALALAPIVALALRRAALRGGRAVPVAALVLALSITTLAIEFVAQALVLGVVLALVAAPGRRGLSRLAVAALLGLGLAALPIFLVSGIVAETLRGQGLPASEALQKSLNIVTLGQVLLPGFLGAPGDSLRVWWAGRLFPDGSPYFLSLYLGPLAVATALVGGDASRRRERLAVVLVAALAFWFALGRAGGLAPLVLGIAPFFRFPVKALLLAHLALSLCAGFGWTRLRQGDGWGRLAGAGAVLATLVACVPLGLHLAREPLERWLDISPRSATAMVATLDRDALQALALLGLTIALGLAARARRVSPQLAALGLAALIVADVAQAGLGFNRQTSPGFYAPLPRLTEALASPDGGRVFAYGVNASPAVQALLRQAPPRVEVASFLLSRQALNPFLNVLDRVELAEGVDRHSFIPNPPALNPWEYAPAAVGGILDRLRNAGVTRVVSLDPLDHPDLSARATIPTAVSGFSLNVYDLARPWPRAYVACRAVAAADRNSASRAPFDPAFDPGVDVALEERAASAGCRTGQATATASGSDAQAYRVQLDGPGWLVMRESFTPSWRATVDGHPASVLRANGRHRAVALPEGDHVVVLRYRPPGLRAGLIVSGLALALWVGLLWRPAAGGLAA